MVQFPLNKNVFLLFCLLNPAPLSISCVNSCTVDESANVIYIEINIELGFSSVNLGRRRRDSLEVAYTGMIIPFAINLCLTTCHCPTI